MNQVRIAAAALALSTVTLAPLPSLAWGIDFQDTYLNLRYVPYQRDPGYHGSIPELAGNISYANAWTYGSNFVSLDFEQYFRSDRANSVSSGLPSNTNDSLELFGVFRSVLSGNKISGTTAFSVGPIRDIGLEFGGNIATQNDQFASRDRAIVIGPQFSINLPRGFWTVSTVLYKEWNNDGFINTGTNFDPAALIETAWSYPFALGPVPLNFTGFMNFTSPKGRGATLQNKTDWEVLVHPKLMVDVGELLGYTPRKIEAGVGYEYWHNKFGNPSSALPGTEQDSVFVEVGYHF